ncbi:MAG: prephenate dehydratase [Spirochaetales bacterium]|nr:prephenate dehydratase [Leptospiraceae bacterium]MCP5482748.1 prephenate dehydratase [Spirochaetales bacterium]MCP5485242.1 prephenate dehydratase [Spirochaetales bacterium]
MGEPSEDPELSLDALREKINETDRQLVRMIMERALLVRRIGESKRQAGTAIYRPDREKQVYQNIARFAREAYGQQMPMPLSVLEHIYREIMSGSIAIEGGPGVAYLGPPASFSHQALRARFGASLRARPEDTIQAVFRAVESGRDVSFGVVPVDNTTEGAVGPTLDMFLTSELRVYAEHYLRVELNLLYHKEAPLSEIKRLYTLRIAREQCRDWMSRSFARDQLEVVEMSSTAAAARAAAERKDGAAVASELAAETYGLTILERNIEDHAHNATRFFVIGTEQTPPTGDDKTSILCSVHDRPGSLYHMLEPFGQSGVNLTRIESRPSRLSYGDYNFFIDFSGHHEDEAIRRLLQKVEQHTSRLKVLGSYPRMDKPWESRSVSP